MARNSRKYQLRHLSHALWRVRAAGEALARANGEHLATGVLDALTARDLGRAERRLRRKLAALCEGEETPESILAKYTQNLGS